MFEPSEYMLYNPYDNKISKRVQGEDENFFKEKLFVDYPDSVTRIINEIESAVKAANTHAIVFYGKSGTGKTTFLHYVCDEERKKRGNDQFSCDFLNLIEFPLPTKSSSIMNDFLDVKLRQLLDKEVVSIFLDILDDVEKKHIIKDHNIFLKGTDDITGAPYNYVDLFIDFLGKCERAAIIDSYKDELLSGIKHLDEKIALNFISFILKECYSEGKFLNEKFCVFVFDNLDELDQIYLNDTLNHLIYTAFSKAQSFFESYTDYDFLSQCTILQSYRDISIRFPNMTQLIDRDELLSTKIVFSKEYRVDLSEVIDKRAEAANVTCAKLWKSERMFIRNAIGRLFNYDYRMVLKAMSGLADNPIDNYTISNLDVLNTTECKVGIRGMILFYILNGRETSILSRFKLYASKEIQESGCNLIRMCFTLLSNLTRQSIVGDIEEETNSNVDGEKSFVPLRVFTDKILSWYNQNSDKYSAKSIYDTLFVAGYLDYAKPAFLVGDVVDQFVKQNIDKANIQDVSEYCAKLYYDNPSMLSFVSILVNPLCEAYPQKVFIHFEYFNILSVIGGGYDSFQDRNNKPLFQLRDELDIKDCLKRVFFITKKIIEKADKNLCEHCPLKTLCDNGKQQSCSEIIKEMNETGFLINGSLYASRTITSHINYLDAFRRYQWLLDEKEGLEPNRHVQMMIVDGIKKYVDLVKKRRVQDPSIVRTIKEIQENIDYFKHGNVPPVWHPINEHKKFIDDEIE